MSSENPTKQKTILSLILVVIFIFIICLPLIDQTFDIDPTIPHNENRNLVEFPDLEFNVDSIMLFPKKFDRYYNDNFGFRETLLRLHILAKYFTIGAFSNPKVIFGKEDWLFYKSSGALDYYRAIEPLKQEQVVRWFHVFRERRDWLAKQGINYLLVVVPLKHNVYPEYLPDHINRVNEKSRFDQLLAYMKANSDINILDLRPTLLKAKEKKRIFHRTDTHWNEIGAYYAYEEIVRSLSKIYRGMEPLPISKFEIQTSSIPGGDLAGMMGITDLFPEENFRLLPQFSWRSYPMQLIGYSFLIKGVADYFTNLEDRVSKLKDALNGLQSLNEISEEEKSLLSVHDLNLYMKFGNDNSKLPKAIMFHDSYTVKSLFYFLTNHFNRIVYLWRDNSNPISAFEPELIKREKPSIVIQEMGERLLMKDPPVNPKECRILNQSSRYSTSQDLSKSDSTL